MTDERTTRLGFPYTDEELADMGCVSFDYDLDQSPRKGETFEEWQRRTGHGQDPQPPSDAA